MGLLIDIARIMTGCGCTQFDDSSKFIKVKGIIVFTHNSDRIVNIMMNKQLTRQGTILQVALLVGKCASWIAAKLNIHRRQKRGIAHGIVESLLTCIYISLTTNLGVWVLHDSESAQPMVSYFS